jgi:hypothetical protein
MGDNHEKRRTKKKPKKTLCQNGTISFYDISMVYYDSSVYDESINHFKPKNNIKQNGTMSKN